MTGHLVRQKQECFYSPSIDGEMPLVPVKDGEKPLSIAIDELNSGKIKIIAEDADK